jgi:hypothetical protein
MERFYKKLIALWRKNTQPIPSNFLFNICNCNAMEDITVGKDLFGGVYYEKQVGALFVGKHTLVKDGDPDYQKVCPPGTVFNPYGCQLLLIESDDSNFILEVNDYEFCLGKCKILLPIGMLVYCKCIVKGATIKTTGGFWWDVPKYIRYNININIPSPIGNLYCDNDRLKLSETPAPSVLSEYAANRDDSRCRFLIHEKIQTFRNLIRDGTIIEMLE